MTEEQIADLVFRTDWRCVDDVARLLEERKRLLKALREARPMLGAAAVERALHGRVDHSQSIMAAEQNALTALAFAEEAAP